MKAATIEELAYDMKGVKDNNRACPIFFLGAGASKTEKIPLASEIITDILAKAYKAVRCNLRKEQFPGYLDLMSTQQPRFYLL